MLLLYSYIPVTVAMCISRLEKELSECERRNKLSHRWLQSDRQYKELEHSLLFNKKEQILLELWKVSQRRLFLLKLKRKYAGIYAWLYHANVDVIYIYMQMDKK